jgi:hypothetical protein
MLQQTSCIARRGSTKDKTYVVNPMCCFVFASMLSLSCCGKLKKPDDTSSYLAKPSRLKITKCTIALENKDYPILMVSFDISDNHEHIVMNKILPVITRERIGIKINHCYLLWIWGLLLP